MLAQGTMAPDFTLESDTGNQVSLSDYRGKKVVLYFYPKDDTPGCTAEACNFRDDHSPITATGAVVLGISPDPIKSHQRFKLKFELPFALLSDPNHKVAEMYGAWGEKRMYGRTSFGIVRSSFLIDASGRVVRAWYGVKPEDTVPKAQQALAATSGR